MAVQKPEPILLASPGAYQRLAARDLSIQRAFEKLVTRAFSGRDAAEYAFQLHVQGGDGVITLPGGPDAPDLFILAGRGEGFGPPEAHRLPEGHGVYPPREELRRGRYGPLRRLVVT